MPLVNTKEMFGRATAACGGKKEAKQFLASMLDLFHEGGSYLQDCNPNDIISECLTETSHNMMLNLLKDTWKIAKDETVTVTPIGTLYFYNDEWDENSAYNNRLVVIYHLDNGIVPGGFYTYLGPNGNVVIKCVTEDDGTEYFSVVRKPY